MKKLSTIVLLSSLFCANFASFTVADTLIYDNSGWEGDYFWPTNSDYNEEFLDYGSSSGGLVSKFEIGYATSLSNPGTLYVRFWQGTTRWQMGSVIKTIAISDLQGSPNGTTYAFYREYIIPEEDRFELPAGNFGYSYEFSWSYNESGPLLASGGLSNENYFWVYQVNTWYGQQQVGDGYAGFYMKVYTGPALADITCDITGNKFDDADGDGVWDAGEQGLGGWEMYVDTNGNDQFDPGVDPNVVTDPNGVYFFENLEFADPNDTKTFVIREVMQNGWTQTLPGGPDYEYAVLAEPNNLYGPYDFGNTDQPVTKYGGGDGTPGDPYQIKTAAHMNEIGTHQEDWGSQFKLMNNIDMSGITGEQYNIIGYHNSTEDYLHFTGTFDGNNHTIQNFNYTTSADKDAVGLFGYTENAQIMDLALSNATVSTAGGAVGGLAGYQKYGTISNCHATSSVSGAAIIGGLIGYLYEGAVSQCTSDVTITTPTGSEAIGGLIGFSRGSVSECSSAGVVIAGSLSKKLGGLVGMLYNATVTDSFSSVVINGGVENKHVGGLAGYQTDGTVTDCYATGAVDAGNASEGVGGLLGLFQGTAMLERCYSTGDVTVGENSSAVGGLIGYHFSGDITSSFSTGNVSSSSAQGVGGLIGIHNPGAVRHCYCTGNVTSDNESVYVGGFAGASFGDIFCSYSTGTISATSAGDMIGSFSGLSSAVVNCFWNSQTSGLPYSGGGKPRTAAQMQKASNYINWNTSTETNWVLDEGNDYPHLIWEGTPGTNLPAQSITDFLGGQGTQAEPYLIEDANDLNIVGVYYDQWDKEYLLTSDIDMTVIGGNEFNMIGTENIPFSGTFDGNGYWIDHFSYITLGHESNVGLFRVISGTASDISFDHLTISLPAGSSIGGLSGYAMPSSVISYCYVKGNISAGDDSGDIGGMVGALEGDISNCDSQINITLGGTSSFVGGLIGSAYGDGSVTQCSSIASISSGNDSEYIGGLVGSGNKPIVQGFSTGAITVGNNCRSIGGLVGEFVNQVNDITNCYSKVDLTVGDSCQKVGGLVGRFYGGGDIFDCYSMGAVACGQSSLNVGGLVGESGSGSYAYDSYWDKQTSEQDSSATGTGLLTDDMLTQSSYNSWDFTNTWRICDGMNYPRLQWEPLLPWDFVCPDGVEVADLMVLCEEWLAVAPEVSADMAPAGGDGKVDLLDWTHLANAWMTSSGQPGWDEQCDMAPATPDGTIDVLDLSVFADQWLYRSAHYADIAPEGSPDGVVNMQDFALFCENWGLGL